ncbi:hypothetical protein N7532_002402 [Penicillium argentinense]|uniref:Rhodopsin domain-containing protein n=1 Tax=Penicillium argentinense TaxID=1131581 RepID=A0A9W9KLH9_9EURO|nr:uncharacterized protein N7532_002402 [Penicillium argentinense]KAJ5109757.1 hypothetical protein N7532_002402 [Penicillium argentinense]
MANLTEDFSPILRAVNIIFSILATFAVIGRFAARRIRNLTLGIDDWMICIALLLNWAIPTTRPGQTQTFTRYLYFIQITYVPAPTAVKLSLLFLYRRIFIHTRFVYLVYTMIGVILIWGMINTFLVIFFCTPISAMWTGKGNCLNVDPYIYAVVNVVTTVIVWAMPIPRVWSLQLPRGQRVGISFIFALGLLAETGVEVTNSFVVGSDIATAIGRVTLIPDNSDYDKTWEFGRPCMVHIIEISTGIVCTCLPTMRISVQAAVASLRGYFPFICRSRSATPLNGLKGGSPISSNDKPEPRNMNIGLENEGECWRSGGEGCHTEITRARSGERDWERDGNGRRIFVREEVDIEMRVVEGGYIAG